MKTKRHSRFLSPTIIFSMTTGTSKGHLNLFKSINGAPREEAEGDKKFSLSYVVFIRPRGRNGLFLQTCSACDKNNNSFHVAIHRVNHDNKIQCFIYSNWSIFMSFEWQAAQFGVHHDPKSCNWQTKSRSRALVEHRWKSITMNATKGTTTLASFSHICGFFWTLMMSVYRRGLKVCVKTFLLTIFVEANWNKCRVNRHCWRSHVGGTSRPDSGDPFLWTINTTTSSHSALDQITISAAGSKGGPGRHNFCFLTHD